MVNGDTPKNLQELYEFYDYKNSWFPTSGASAPPKVYLNPLILLLSKKLNVSLYDILEYIQNGNDWNASLQDAVDAEISRYFYLDGAMGSCDKTTKVFKAINEKYLELEWNINEPINQLLNQKSSYYFRTIENKIHFESLLAFPLANRYYLYENRGGWSYSPGIFILKNGKEQPSFLNWRESPF